ncbi:hypothetical protein L873DRAFT_1786538 [Choiromyces venosus 120613-1]|uniref:Uncharacterized protein n=1 Tax=Choiromyces venosus 120613-1 TaxID=1336337 RepID=A0A3N4K470_9PEZI|nr:hypothetical protein L873DRAFT_1786538 [Choiromyces venosus 120613-1]
MFGLHRQEISTFHPAPVVRIEEHQKLGANIACKQELYGSGMTTTSKDSDIEMGSSENKSDDGDDVLVGLWAKVRHLKQQQHQFKSQLKARGKVTDSAEEPKQAVPTSPAYFKNLSLV